MERRGRFQSESLDVIRATPICLSDAVGLARPTHSTHRKTRPISALSHHAQVARDRGTAYACGRAAWPRQGIRRCSQSCSLNTILFMIQLFHPRLSVPTLHVAPERSVIHCQQALLPFVAPHWRSPVVSAGGSTLAPSPDQPKPIYDRRPTTFQAQDT